MLGCSRQLAARAVASPGGMAQRQTKTWRHARGELSLDRCLVMGIVNLTPDSFFDGGRWLPATGVEVDVGGVIEHCRRLVRDGADILDIGGESTRPGAEPVDEQVELARVVPVIDALQRDGELSAVPISIDTRHAEVARIALARGAAIINDVSGLADPGMAEVAATRRAGLVIGHLRGQPATMLRDIHFDDLLAEVASELGRAVAEAEAAGVERARCVIDPGVGFGKTARQSAALVASSRMLSERVGCPVLIGASRKRFLAALTHDKPVEERMLASVIAALAAARHGAAAVRVHDVAETVEALRVFAGIEAAAAVELSSGGA